MKFLRHKMNDLEDQLRGIREGCEETQSSLESTERFVTGFQDVKDTVEQEVIEGMGGGIIINNIENNSDCVLFYTIKLSHQIAFNMYLYYNA